MNVSISFFLLFCVILFWLTNAVTDSSNETSNLRNNNNHHTKTSLWLRGWSTKSDIKPTEKLPRLTNNQTSIESSAHFATIFTNNSVPAVISDYECKNTAEQSIRNACTDQYNTSQRYNPLNSSIFQVFKKVRDRDTKYYREAPADHHRDARFYKSRVKKPNVDQRREDLRNLFVEWNQFTAEHNLTYWIAHGLLIGYYWNNDLLPWDLDLDVQVLAHDLLAGFAALSGTRHRGRYLLDINPHSRQRLHQKDNVIDGRFVDTRTGLYLDITGLAYSPRHERLQCKSVHNYHPHAIFPLRRSVFCGVAAWVPNDVENILKEEYKPHVTTLESYVVKIGGMNDTYNFDKVKKQWIKAD